MSPSAYALWIDLRRSGPFTTPPAPKLLPTELGAMQIVGRITEPERIESALKQLQPDVAMMLCNPGDASCAVRTQDLRRRHPNVRVMVLTDTSPRDQRRPLAQAA